MHTADNTHIDRSLFEQVMVPNYQPQAIIPVKGRGSRLWDQQGREYIDFAGGIAVNALGHSHPALIAALRDQADKLWHLSNVFTNEPALQLAQQLTAATFADRVYFANSGAEANEAAFKLVRKYAYDHFGEDKHEIIAFEQAFHGRTLFTVSVGGQAKYRQGFEPVPGGIRHVPYNDIAALEAAISDKTCAVVMEPILGEGGIQPARGDFATAVRRLCDKHQALLVFDEIQTGMGRTGPLYAYMELGVTPDIMTTAKALGCGFPIGAMLCREDVAASFGFGSHGSTYGGNPLACAVAKVALSLIDTAETRQAVKHKHELCMEKLEYINQRHHIFTEIRGKGLLLGAELVPEWQGQAGKLLASAIEHGVMHLIAGPSVLRFTPSLIIPDSDINEGMERLDQSIASILANRG